LRPYLHVSRNFLAAAAILAALPISRSLAQDLPDGSGKEALKTVCTQCHDLNQVVARKRTAVDWSMTVDKMVTQGAKATDEQFNAILDYLIRNFRRPMNVNQASASSLAGEFDFSEAEAEAIVAYREKRGPFKSADELKAVPGLDAAKVDAAKDWMAFL
jgi:competence protein ComEA